MAAARVVAVANVGNGMDVDLTLDDAPAGAVTANASRLPGDPATTSKTVTDQGGNVYRVRVREGTPGVDPAIPIRLNYYLQLFDGATLLPSYQVGADLLPAAETCAWVCQNDPSDWLDQCERAISDILIDNLQALNLGMEIYLTGKEFPNGAPARLQALHAGIPAHQEGAKYPQISLRTNTVHDDPYFANPRSDYLPLQTQIACYLCHQGMVNWEPLVRSLGMAVWNVLNQTHYVEVALDCGLVMTECYAMTGSSSEDWDDEARIWVGAFQITYQSKLFVGVAML